MVAEKSLRKRENTRARLLEAGAEVFTEKGFSGAKIDDVVKKAGFTRGAFYSNYESMEDLLRDVIVQRAEQLLADARSAIDSLEGPPSVESIVNILDTIRPEGRTMYILTTEYTLYRMRHPEAPPLAVAERDHFSSLLVDTVKTVLERMGRCATVDASTVADVVVVFFLDSVASEGIHHDQADRSLMAQVIEALTMGLSTPINPGQ